MKLIFSHRCLLSFTRCFHMSSVRSIHISSVKLAGPPEWDDWGAPPTKSRNFQHFTIPNRIEQWEHHKLPAPLLEVEYSYPVWRDTLCIKWPGYWFGKRFVHIPEMEAQLIVPDLTGFELKPYVSYKAPDVPSEEFTAKELFEATYAEEIIDKFQKGEKVEPIEFDENDALEKKHAVEKCGADLFCSPNWFGIQRE